MEPLIFDTTFLIDFQRERYSSPGGAHALLQDHAEAVAYLPVTAYGEFADGFPERTNAAFLSVVESFELLPVTRAVADTYADMARVLRAKGGLIGANDLWIAATALEWDMALVTRSRTEDQRLLRSAATSEETRELSHPLDIVVQSCNRAIVNVTIKLDDALCREARHRAVDADLSLSGWIADLIRERLGLSPAPGRPGKTLLEMLGDEKAGGTDLEIPSLVEKPRPADLED